MQAIHFPKTSFRANIRGYIRQPGKGLDSCLWRELIQNARDAGATRVDCSLAETPEHIILTFRDNGKGMDWETLERGMLTYGGSIKSTGAAGGFGMAKLVVCFASDETTIRTRDLAVRIDGILYEKLESTEFLQGTELVIKCPKSEAPDTRLEPTLDGLKFLLARCDLRGMRVYFDGQRIEDCRHDKDIEFVVATFPKSGSTAYYWKRRRGFTDPHGSNVAVLTHRGIWVCDFPVPSDVKGAILIDSDADPKAVLNDTRTNLSDYWQRKELESWFGKLNQGSHSTLKTKKFVKRFDGGLFVAEKAKAAEAMVSAALAEVVPEVASGGYADLALTGGEMREVMAAAAVKLAETVKDNPEAAERISARIKAAAEGVKTDVPQSTQNLAAAIRQLAWDPALMVVNELEQAVNKKFLPESMSPRARQVLRVWTEVVRQFLLWNGEHRPFGVGFIFSEDTAAQFRTEEDGTIWFLINPADSQGRLRLKVSSKDDVRRIVVSAAHEAAHAKVGDGTIHGDSFVVAFGENCRKAMEHATLLKKVVKNARK